MDFLLSLESVKERKILFLDDASLILTFKYDECNFEVTFTFHRHFKLVC